MKALESEFAMYRYLRTRKACVCNRSLLVRRILDEVVAQLPGRPIPAMADGAYATKDFLRDLPASVKVISRLLSRGSSMPSPLRQPARVVAVGLRKGPCQGRPKPSCAKTTAGSPIPRKQG